MLNQKISFLGERHLGYYWLQISRVSIMKFNEQYHAHHKKKDKSSFSFGACESSSEPQSVPALSGALSLLLWLLSALQAQHAICFSPVPLLMMTIVQGPVLIILEAIVFPFTLKLCIFWFCFHHCPCHVRVSSCVICYKE